MKPIFKTFAAGALMAMTLSVAAPAVALDEQQKKEMGEFIREYLVANPEVMIEVQNALEKKQTEQRSAQANQALQQNQAAIFNSEHDISLGNPKGDVTVVEFFDYNCGYCKRAMTDMDQIIAKDPNIRFVLKEFPILGPDSLAAHKVSNAVRLIAPDKYPEFHRALLGGEHASEEIAVALAGSMGIKEADIRKSMEANPNTAAVQEAYELANSLGVTGTPTYVVGDEAVFGAVGRDTLEQKVANLRTCGKATCS